jgi:TolB-like protein
MTRENGRNGFFEELKRRNVFRVAVAYLVTAWLLLQVADIVLLNIEAPGWVIQAFMLALGIGLPLALIFAWAYELTPEGIKREKDVDRSESIARQTGRKLDFAIIGVLAAAVIVLLIDRFRGADEPLPARAEAATAAVEDSVPPAPSIAVLPFVNMSSDPEQEYFSDGISEEILNALARVKELKVAGRTSSFAFKGQNQDLRQIGETLGVEHILEGSVRKSGATVRITAQLIQVDDGFHLWSATYDRELINVFAIQDEIATAILEQLKAHLVGLETAPLPAVAQRTDADVYDQYLLARQRLYERKRLSIESAAELLDKAIAKDPAYAPAYAQRGIAALLLSERNYGDMTLAEAGSQGRLYLDKALALDPGLAEAWAGLGLLHVNRPGGYREGIAALEKALAINPSLIDASNWLQVAFAESGENRRALAILEDMLERDPLYPPALHNAVFQYNQFGRQSQSRALIERTRPFMPNDPLVLQAEASTWLSLGQPAKALPLLEEARAQQPSDAVLRHLWSTALLTTGQFTRLLEENGAPWTRVIALTSLGRQEEAGMLARERATEGDIGVYLWHLAQAGQQAQIVELVESRWADLGAFEAEFPDDGTGYGSMLHIAHAYSVLDRPEGFEEAMRRTRAAHDRALEQGIEAPFLFLGEARYHTLAGDPDRAIRSLEQAADRGLVVGAPLARFSPELASLRGLPGFEAVQARLSARLNTERAALGLEPLET